MGLLIDGEWHTDWYKPDEKGRFVRNPSKFRDWVKADGSSAFPVENDRYHLYVSLACPWAHRTLILRKLKGLENAISLSIVDPFMGEDGWWFSNARGTIPDTVNGATFLRELYVKAKPDYTGRVTVPVLWDKKQGTIVNNESRNIVRMLDHEFGALAKHDVDLAPPELRDEVDAMITRNYEPINNGVYRSGFATTQEAYEEAVTDLFDALDRCERTLSTQRYLCGNRLTEADVCLFTTLLRFDAVYYSHFKCNLRRIVDCPNLWGFVRDVYQTDGIAETCDLDHIKQHYYRSHETINPTRIVPKGPILDFDAPHERDELGAAA